jgi:DNA mismatch repair ATPase MutL
MLKSDGVVHSSLFLPTSLGRWKVCGVLLQIPQDEESESSPLTRSRQNELIFVNQRLVQHHTTLADAIQKMLILYVPSGKSPIRFIRN